MRIVHVLFQINNGKDPDIHVHLSEELPPEAKLWDELKLDDGSVVLLTGVRSPPSKFATVRPR